MPKVSVIVPVYNVEKYLERCLNSLLRQTCKDYEVICIDDCGKDRSGDILEKFQKKYPSVIRILKNEQNMGSGKSRNRGIACSRGEYILFVDSDDYVKKDYIQTYLNVMESNAYDIVIGGFIRDIGGKKKIHKRSDSVWSNTTYSITCAKMFRKSFIEENELKFIDIICYEDVYFNLAAFYLGATYHVMDYAGYYYYYNPNSTTGSMNYESDQERFVFTAFERFLDKYDIRKIPKERQRVIEYTYIAGIVNALITFGHGCGIKRMRKKYEYVMKDLNEKFPDYKNNPYVGIFKPKGQTAKIRLAVGITMGLHRVGLDRLMFYLISLV